jgi:hypothetical protein
MESRVAVAYADADARADDAPPTGAAAAPPPKAAQGHDAAAWTAAFAERPAEDRGTGRRADIRKGWPPRADGGAGETAEPDGELDGERRP